MNPKFIPLMLAMVPSLFRKINLDDLERIKAITRATFPDVTQLSTSQLDLWLGGNNPAPLLIDVRTPEEFRVSHLKGARNLRSVQEIMNFIGSNPEETIVVYCSVGFRSSRIASRLQKRGVRNVQNLEGSIFQWANENRALYREEEKVREVHPCRQKWSGLLDSKTIPKFK